MKLHQTITKEKLLLINLAKILVNILLNLPINLIQKYQKLSIIMDLEV